MLDLSQAQKALKTTFPWAKLKAWARYRNLYLFRVEIPLPGEENYDPFFSVDDVTGEAGEFSIIHDGNISEISNLKWNEI